jgi:hypothetical protein
LGCAQTDRKKADSLIQRWGAVHNRVKGLVEKTVQDYGHYNGQRLAVDEYLAARN